MPRRVEAEQPESWAVRIALGVPTGWDNGSVRGTEYTDWLIEHCERCALEGPHGHPLTAPAFQVDQRDLEQLRQGVRRGLIELLPNGRFNTVDRPRPEGHWALLSFYGKQTILNGEYIPQLACYVDLIARLGYDPRRVLFEPGDSGCRLDHAVLDDTGHAVIVGEAKVDPAQPHDLAVRVTARYSAAPTGPVDRPARKGREHEAWKLADALWKMRPDYLWLVAPGKRQAYALRFDPLALTRVDDLPTASELGLTRVPPDMLTPAAHN